MTNPSPTDLITKALPAIEWIAENTDCPALDDWCGLNDPVAPGIYGQTEGTYADNPPAVLAAICVWVVNLPKTLNTLQSHWFFSPPMYLEHGGYDDDDSEVEYYKREWYWSIRDVENKQQSHNRSHEDFYASCVDFLLAIVECLKGESK